MYSLGVTLDLLDVVTEQHGQLRSLKINDILECISGSHNITIQEDMYWWLSQWELPDDGSRKKKWTIQWERNLHALFRARGKSRGGQDILVSWFYHGSTIPGEEQHLSRSRLYLWMITSYFERAPLPILLG